MGVKSKHPEKKKVSWRSRGQVPRGTLAFRDRKHSRGGHPRVAEADRTAGLPAGLTGLPMGSLGWGLVNPEDGRIETGGGTVSLEVLSCDRKRGVANVSG